MRETTRRHDDNLRCVSSNRVASRSEIRYSAVHLDFLNATVFCAISLLETAGMKDGKRIYKALRIVLPTTTVTSSTPMWRDGFASADKPMKQRARPAFADPYYAHYDQEFEVDGVCVRDLVMRDPLKDMESSLLKRNATRIEVKIL
ncbi:hypothetical protein ALC53_06367 [Atta colombica]|uniref:Uncharacterized protein n=1 Tax=Atta colombica TaxID=520822 RepID=A0A195BET2_9HYME|nr:hypothetical protein ALC53_06367 [Atta colombica]